MGMPAHNDMEASGCRVQVEGVHVVKNVQEDFARLSHRRFGQRPGPIGSVHVSAHGNDRSEFPQRSEDFRLAYITGVKNQLRTTKRLDRLRSQQPVSIRDQANPRRRSLHEEILTSGLFVQSRRKGREGA